MPPAFTSSGGRKREMDRSVGRSQDQDAMETVQPKKAKYTKPLTNNISTADRIKFA